MSQFAVPNVGQLSGFAFLFEGWPVPETRLLLAQFGTFDAGLEVVLGQVFALHIALPSTDVFPAPATIAQLEPEEHETSRC